MKYKTSFSCLLMGISACGFLGTASAETETGAAKQTQTILFSPAATGIGVGGTIMVKASSTSGLSVSLVQDSSTTKYCAFNQATGLVTGLAVGTCKINASQAGNASYSSAQAILSIQVKQTQPKIQTQTISFGAAPKITAPGGKGTVAASASSGLAVALTSKTPSVCSVSGNTVTGLTVGLCTIAADQPGNSTYAPATEVTQSFNVTQNSTGGNGSNGGNGPNSSGGTKLAVTAPFNCSTLASSGNAADDGRRAYMRLNCVSCHGQDGSGGMGPNIKGAGSDVAEAVNGEGAMPSFAGFLCPNDVIDLEAYLGSTSKTQKFLDWDVQLENILDGFTAPKPTDVISGP